MLTQVIDGLTPAARHSTADSGLLSSPADSGMLMTFGLPVLPSLLIQFSMAMRERILEPRGGIPWHWARLLSGGAVVLWLLGSLAVQAAEDAPAVDYLREIKPILTKHCAGCHGTKKQEGGLRLDTAAFVVAGGDSGPAVVAGKAGESRLVQAISGAADVSKMPPEDRPQLSVEQIGLLRRWVEAGAKGPANEQAEQFTSTHWSFQRPRRPNLPGVGDPTWPLSPLDSFILSKLEQKQLTPSREASRATLVRRLSLDLRGLLPSVEEVVEFETDSNPDAVERLADRLLASPAYGERWGRHWLDLARYADSNGYTRDFGRDIWPYRDWVLRAINQDLPFDRFTLEQLAGDLLPNASNDQLVATGFHRNTLINEEGGTDQEQFRIEAVADRVATTGAVWLGLTLNCARCHNHKYDPISQREFYQFFALLNNCDEPSIEAPTQRNLERGDLPRRDDIRRQIAELDKQVEMQRGDLEAAQKEWETTVTPEQRARLPGPVQVAYDMPFDKRDAANKKMIEDYFRQSEVARKKFPLLDEIARLRDIEPKIPQTLVMKERAEPRETHIHKRGDFLNLGVRVAPATPAVLHPIPATSADAGHSPGRLDLARWLVTPANPLVGRVVTNRFWLQFFGRGLVETEDDFGVQGAKPTNPELLDWLAADWPNARDAELPRSPSQVLSDVVPGAWSVKRLHRQIVTSATYRQSSAERSDLAAADPRNELWGRQNRLRVDAELVRDAALAASGLLARQVGGPSVMPPQPDGVYAFTQDPKPWKAAEGTDRYRRGMYTFFWRSLPYPMLTVFDAPTGNVTCTRRIRSNTPLQALTLANDVTFLECSRALAERILSESPADIEHQARHAFRLGLAREPSPRELERLVALVQQQRSAYTAQPEAARQLAGVATSTEASLEFVSQRAAWTAVGRVLLNLDEFITRE